jgi:hypothetical protein
MTIKTDRVIEKLVFGMRAVMCDANEKLCTGKSRDRMRNSLCLLEARGLAKLVERIGEPPIWTATDTLIRQAGVYSAESQPNPVIMQIDNSPSAIFNRQLRRCINWVERDFRIENEGPQRQPGCEDLLTVPGLKHDALARLTRNARAIERELQRQASEGRGRW